MSTLSARLQHINWPQERQTLLQNGYTVIPSILNLNETAAICALYDQDDLFRKTVVMDQHGYGMGTYRYFSYPLPQPIEQLRAEIYPEIVAVANTWMEQLQQDVRYPASFENFRQQCRDAGQSLPTALLLRYETGGYNALHQDLYGQLFFPLQMVFMLDEQGTDFEGGLFVLLEQKDEHESKPIVLEAPKGSLIIFTTNFKATRVQDGYTATKMEHGVSVVQRGIRRTLGIIFHDAKAK
jgi:hypothetical protein